MKTLLLTLGLAAALGVLAAGSAQASRGAEQPSAQDANYLRKGTTPQMHLLAEHLVKDHSKSLAESIATAKELGI